MATRKELDQVFKILEIQQNLGTFNDRIKLQKVVYLIENAFEVDLGFNFSWYIHGPYSPTLAKVMFKQEDGNEIQLNESKIKKLEKAKEFFKTHNTRGRLELLGSLHYYLKAIKGKNMSKSKIVKRFFELKPKFEITEIEDSYEIINPYV